MALLYNNPTTVTPGDIITAVSIDDYGNIEFIPVVTQYTSNNVAGITTVNISGGSYGVAQNIILTCDDSQAIIYYTLDGTLPVVN